MSVWQNFGFSESPYRTDPVPATAEGARLLVGRERELKRLKSHLTSSNRHPTIEGDNGVGKTSLVSVAAYELAQAFAADQTGPAFLPLGQPLQLTNADTADSFNRKVNFAVARAFIVHHDALTSGGLVVPDVDRVRRWLDMPLFTSGNAGVTVAGFGGSAGHGVAPNSAAGFSESGFASTVDRWLADCFPSAAEGGFICVIDNLELLETSQAARALLEGMRDSVLGKTGLRWVLCGARGIVRTGASSPRLEGHLMEPLELKPINDNLAAAVVERRIEEFRLVEGAVAPVGPAGFAHLYEVLNRNLRNTFKFCEDFALWAATDAELEATGEDEFFGLLQVWLTEQADRYASDTQLTGRPWEVFNELCDRGGSCSPSDFEEFGFNSPMALRPHVKALESANLVQSSVEDTDKRRKTISVTPRGWLVRYSKTGYRGRTQ